VLPHEALLGLRPLRFFALSARLKVVPCHVLPHEALQGLKPIRFFAFSARLKVVPCHVLPHEALLGLKPTRSLTDAQGQQILLPRHGKNIFVSRRVSGHEFTRAAMRPYDPGFSP